MKQIDWVATLSSWRPLSRADLLTEEEVLKMVALLQHVADNLDSSSIEWFDLKSMRSALDCKISKSELFEEAAKQIQEHKKVWRVTQRKNPKLFTYEMPFVSGEQKYVMYFKVQVHDEKDGLSDPTLVEKVSVDYHIGELFQGVKYVEN